MVLYREDCENGELSWLELDDPKYKEISDRLAKEFEENKHVIDEISTAMHKYSDEFDIDFSRFSVVDKLRDWLYNIKELFWISPNETFERLKKMRESSNCPESIWIYLIIHIHLASKESFRFSYNIACFLDLIPYKNRKTLHKNLFDYNESDITKIREESKIMSVDMETTRWLAVNSIKNSWSVNQKNFLWQIEEFKSVINNDEQIQKLAYDQLEKIKSGYKISTHWFPFCEDIWGILWVYISWYSYCVRYDYIYKCYEIHTYHQTLWLDNYDWSDYNKKWKTNDDSDWLKYILKWDHKSSFQTIWPVEWCSNSVRCETLMHLDSLVSIVKSHFEVK